MRFSERSRSRVTSELPVPLNSSKITSSIRLPVSIKAVPMIVSVPASSVERAAPKIRFGRSGARESSDRVEQNDHVAPGFHHPSRALQRHLGDFEVVAGWAI